MNKFFKRWAATVLAVLSLIGLLVGVVQESRPSSFFGRFRVEKKIPHQVNRKLQSTPYSRYCVLNDVWRSDSRFDQTITLVLHLTDDYLEYLDEHAVGWEGGISASIFLPPSSTNETAAGIREKIVDVLAKLNRLKAAKRSEKFSIHFFFERPNLSECPQFQMGGKARNKAEIKHQSYSSTYIYPINVARNIARRGVRSKLFLSGDVEQLFSANFEPRMRRLAHQLLIKEKRKMVLVYRRFELDDDVVEIPKTKKELRKLFDSNKAVPFHKFFYSVGHHIPAIDEWFETKEDRHETRIFSILNYTSAAWEPQFVANSEMIPFHDESFPFRMRSNTHLANELCRAGFAKFAVVTDLFTVHRGIKRKESEVEAKVKKHVKKNGYFKTVKRFNRRLDEQYPETKGKCPELKP